jgi:hypothetical protein
MLSPKNAGCLRARAGTDGVLVAFHEIVVKAILEQAPGTFTSAESRAIGLVFAELDLVRPVELDRIDAKLWVLDHNIVPEELERRLPPRREPAPGVPEPDLGQHVNL